MNALIFQLSIISVTIITIIHWKYQLADDEIRSATRYLMKLRNLSLLRNQPIYTAIQKNVSIEKFQR